MKRVFPQESAADSHSLISNGIQPGALGGSRRMQTSVAMLGIAFSFGTSAPMLFEPESALAAEGSVVAVLPAAGDQAGVVRPKFVTDSGDLAATAYHTVEAGDSLWHIAEKHQADVQSIKSANGIEPDEVLRVGQVLRVPSVIEGLEGSQSGKVQRLALSNNVRGSVGGDLSVVFGEELPLDSDSEVTANQETVAVAKLDDGTADGPEVEGMAAAEYELTAAALAASDASAAASVPKAELATQSDSAEVVETVAVLPDSLPASMHFNEVQANPLAELAVPKSELAVGDRSELSLSGADTLASRPESEPATAVSVVPGNWQNQAIQASSEAASAVVTDKALTVAALGSAPGADSHDASSGVSPVSVIGAQVYQVKPGDTLWNIASRHGLSVDELMQHNASQQPENLMVGDQLSIPQVDAQASAQASEPTLARAVGLEAEQNREVAIQNHLARIRAAANREIDQEELKARIIAVRQSLEQSELQTEGAAPLEFHTALDEPVAADKVEFDSHVASGGSYQAQSLASSSTTTIERDWTVTDAAVEETDLVALAAPVDAAGELLDTATIEPSVPENMMAAAPMSPDVYRATPQLPVGEVVTPGMPILPDSGEFLPEAPNRFNGYVWPAQGTLTSGYGWRWGRMHRGIDIAGPVGTPIMAAAPGVVVRSGWNSGGYGNLVDIRHADGSLTRYAHNSRLLVREGQQVRQGQQIAEMGSTGYSTGPHLHFEVHLPNSGTVNPLAYLPGR